MIRDASSLGMFSSSPPSLSYWRVKSAFVCVSLGLDWVCAGLSFRALEKAFLYIIKLRTFLCRVRAEGPRMGLSSEFRVAVGFLGQSSVTKFSSVLNFENKNPIIFY
jgi:hypothetical protein